MYPVPRFTAPSLDSIIVPCIRTLEAKQSPVPVYFCPLVSSPSHWWDKKNSNFAKRERCCYSLANGISSLDIFFAHNIERKCSRGYLEGIIAMKIESHRVTSLRVTSCHLRITSLRPFCSSSLYFIGSLVRDSSGEHTKCVKHDPSVPFDLADVNWSLLQLECREEVRDGVNEKGRERSAQRERKETMALTKITVHDDWMRRRGKGNRARGT